MSDRSVPRASVIKSAAEDPEAVWLREVYRPTEPNLTLRAAIVGALIGGVMCLSNLYVFFKTGWSMGVTLTACILAFAAFQGLQALGLVKKPLGVLENNALTTVASGAGYMTGGGNMAAYGALVIVIATTPQLAITEPSALPMIVWFAVIAALGVFVAIPIKRQLINKEALAFPTGTATAETIESIHSAAAEAAAANAADRARAPGAPRLARAAGMSKAAMLGYASLFGALVALFRDGFKLLPGFIPIPLQLAGHELAKWTITFKTEVVLLGAGALMSFRTGWSLLVGGLLTYAVMAPELLERGLIHVNDKGDITYKAIVGWTLWPGAAILVGAGLTSFLLDWRSLARAFQGLGTVFGKKQAGPAEGIAAVESPEWWFPAALIVLGPIIVVLMTLLFAIPVWAAVIAVPLAVVMGFIASRVTGETDVTPTKALGPVTQMLYGVITPGNMTGNIMSANVTGGIGLHSADLLTTLKTGWLLGARPRHQLYAQLIGVVVGAAIVVPAFMLIIPDPTPEQLAAGITTVLGTEEWPAPSCLVWAGVSEAFTHGIDNMHSSTKTAIVVGLALGVALTLFEKVAPKHLKAYIPSANGLGIAMVIPASNCIAMFLGAAVAELLRRRQQDGAVIPVASGLIAGESIMGIIIVVLSLPFIGINLAL